MKITSRKYTILNCGHILKNLKIISDELWEMFYYKFNFNLYLLAYECRLCK